MKQSFTTAMNNNRKTFRILKLEKSCDFARRKNDVEDKMLDTKLKVMEKKERTVRQKLYQIRREKYSRTFYKSPEKPKFVDVNVCETEEGESNKLNLITASGVERTKNRLRRKSIAVEELNPGKVVRVCVSSKLEDKVTRDETGTPSTSLPPIVKAPSQKRRHSLAIVTNVEQHNMADLFTSVASYMQSISEESEGATFCKDDLYFGRKTEEKHSELETTFHERTGRNAGQCSDLDTNFSEKLRDLSLQTTVEEVEEKNRRDCSSSRNKAHSCGQKALGEDDASAKVFKLEPVKKTETGCNSSKSVSSSPNKKLLSARREKRDCPSLNLRPRAQSSRSYSDSSLQEKVTFRKCSTPIPVLSKNHSRMRSVDASTAACENAAMGHKCRIRSLSTGSEQRGAFITEKEAQMAEQVIIRQLEIREGAERMKKLSLQHFGNSTLKIPRKQGCNTSPCARRRFEDAASCNTSNSNEGVPRPVITRRYIHHNPHLLRKFVKNYCKNDRGQTVMENVLCKLSGDMPHCRYLRCGDKASEVKTNSNERNK